MVTEVLTRLGFCQKDSTGQGLGWRDCLVMLQRSVRVLEGTEVSTRLQVGDMALARLLVGECSLGKVAGG